MQKLYLHIGTHKTATTWLQHYLGKNSDKLNDLGFYYPLTGRVTQAQHRLGQAIFMRTNPKAVLDQIPIWERFKREIERTRYDNIVISSEEFEWVMHPKLIREFLPNVSIHTIIYLRRQDDYLESLYGQQIRDYHPRLTKTVNQYIAENNLSFLNYQNLLRRWEEASDDVTVRVFDKRTMEGGDIGEDFLKCLGIESIEGFEPPQAAVINHKASLDMEALEFIRQCNRLKLTAVQHDQLVARMIRFNKVIEAVSEKSNRRLLDFESRKLLMEKYKSENSAIVKKYPNASQWGELFAPIGPDVQVFKQSEAFNQLDIIMKASSLIKLD